MAKYTLLTVLAATLLGVCFCQQMFRAGGSLPNLFYDDFSVAADAPLATPRSGQPGPGTSTIVDTENKFSIASGSLECAGGKAAPAWGDPAFSSVVPIPKVAGMTAYIKVTIPATGANHRFGYGSTPGTYPGNVSGYYLSFTPSSTYSPILTAGQEYELALVERGAAGYFTFLRGGIYTTWNLITAVSASTKTSSIQYLGLSNNNSSAFSVKSVRAFYLGGEWEIDNQWAKATQRIASNSAGDTITQAANAFVSWTFTAETGVTKELKVRWTDDDNCWILRCDQGAGTVSIIQRESGGETVRSTKAKAWTNGTSYRIWMRVDGSNIQSSEGGIVYRPGTFNVTATTAKASHAGTDLVSWPLSGWDLTQKPSTHPAIPKRFFAYGDSKTATDENGTYTGWAYYLVNAAAVVQYPTRKAYPGRNVAQVKTDYIDADMAAAVGVPDVFLINLGANDATINSTWTSNAAYIIDAVHTKFPLCPVYWVTTWARGTGLTFSNALYAALDSLMASRAWFHHGIDERVLLENGDDGVTYTSDGTHPNDAGYALEGQAWKTLLGW